MFKPGFHLDFLAFCCSFWFFVPTKSYNEQCHALMETSTKNQNQQQKAMMSNNRHICLFWFLDIELILYQNQERAMKTSKRQRTANGNTHQKPKRGTKSNKEHFSFPYSFIRTSSEHMEDGFCQEQ